MPMFPPCRRRPGLRLPGILALTFVLVAAVLAGATASAHTTDRSARSPRLVVVGEEPVARPLLWAMLARGSREYRELHRVTGRQPTSTAVATDAGQNTISVAMFYPATESEIDGATPLGPMQDYMEHLRDCQYYCDGRSPIACEVCRSAGLVFRASIPIVSAAECGAHRLWHLING